MDTIDAIRLLERNGTALVALLDHLDPELALWRPQPDKWSFLEVASHLLDEERDDFRTRIRLTLENPEQEWPRIDPEGWVEERNYAGRVFRDVVNELRRERAASLEWLRMTPVDLDASHRHPQLGPMRTGDLLASWAAHDLLHLRQLTRMQFHWLETHAKPYSLDYAGPW